MINFVNRKIKNEKKWNGEIAEYVEVGETKIQIKRNTKNEVEIVGCIENAFSLKILPKTFLNNVIDKDIVDDMINDEKIKTIASLILRSSRYIGYFGREERFYDSITYVFKLPSNKEKRVLAKINIELLFRAMNLYEEYFKVWSNVLEKNKQDMLEISDYKKQGSKKNIVEVDFKSTTPTNYFNSQQNNKKSFANDKKTDEIKSSFVFELEDEYKKESNSKTRNKKFQNNFRKNVLKTMSERCVVTGVCERIEFCHIKPYSNKDSNNYERQDGFNGIILYSGIHKLFDEGLISFENDGTLLISNKLNEIEMQIWKSVLVEGKKYEIGNETGEKTKYLEYHRNNIFRGDK